MPSAITLLTDFGTRDSYVAEVKAALLSRAPAAQLVDVTHEVSPGDLSSARYLLARTWSGFPPGTVHLVVVDPGVGGARRALAVRFHDHAFVAPDNGVLTAVLDGAEVVSLAVSADAAPTFHGRDVFAPAAARLANGEPVAAVGTPVRDPVRLDTPSPVRREGEILGCVVYVDRFGTLVSNIPSASVGDASVVRIGSEFTAPLRRTFSDVGVGELVAFAGSGGTLEVAARNGSAAAVTGAGVGAEVGVSLLR